MILEREPDFELVARAGTLGEARLALRSSLVA